MNGNFSLERNASMGATAALVSCVRNQRASLPVFLGDVMRLLTLFSAGRAILFENDSADGTRAALLEWSARFPNADVILRDGLRGGRTERLAACRNALLERSLQYRFDFTVALDSDYDRPLKMRQFRALLARSHEWDAAFATTRPYYYDYWALRHELYGYSDVWRGGFFRYMTRWPLEVPPGRKLKVRSAFNGVAIYNTKRLRAALLTCRYAGTYPDGYPICEHVPFHECLLKKNSSLRFIVDGDLVATVRRPNILQTLGLHYTLAAVAVALATLCPLWRAVRAARE